MATTLVTAASTPAAQAALARWTARIEATAAAEAEAAQVEQDRIDAEEAAEYAAEVYAEERWLNAADRYNDR